MIWLPTRPQNVSVGFFQPENTWPSSLDPYFMLTAPLWDPAHSFPPPGLCMRRVRRPRSTWPGTQGHCPGTQGTTIRSQGITHNSSSGLIPLLKTLESIPLVWAPIAWNSSASKQNEKGYKSYNCFWDYFCVMCQNFVWRRNSGFSL